MSKQDKINRLPLSAWNAEILRLTAFHIEPTSPQDINWWADLMGEPAETKTVQQRIGGQIEQGLFTGIRGVKLVNQVQPHRIDWSLQLHEPDPQINVFPTIGQFIEVVEIFVDVMARWLKLKTCPMLQRLAFGAILTYPVDSHAAGYRQLSAYLPNVKLDPESSSDFLYQINRVRDSTSKIDGLGINRLSKWSVATLQTMSFSFGQDLDTSMDKGSLLRACHLELDINTKTDAKKPLPSNRIDQIFQELVNLAKEIIKEGDIP